MLGKSSTAESCLHVPPLPLQRAPLGHPCGMQKSGTANGYKAWCRGGNVSVFETTIRILGGLLSAFQLSGDRVFLDKCARHPCAHPGSRLTASFAGACRHLCAGKRCCRALADLRSW